jgi:hypothetical protein
VIVDAFTVTLPSWVVALVLVVGVVAIWVAVTLPLYVAFVDWAERRITRRLEAKLAELTTEENG